MIVRINQFDAPRPEAEAGWPAEGRLGPLSGRWPDGTRAFEVLILDQDEQRRALPTAFRQQQLRQLIPQAIAALAQPDEEVVVRLDGPLAERELLPAFRHLTDPAGQGRFVVADARKLDAAPAEVMTGVRIHPATPQALQALCGDAALGLERSVRLRAFSVPREAVEAVLDIDAPDDERWHEVLGRAGFVLGTVREMRALHVITARFDATAVKSRLMQRLMALAQQAAKAPSGAGARSLAIRRSPRPGISGAAASLHDPGPNLARPSVRILPMASSEAQNSRSHAQSPVVATRRHHVGGRYPPTMATPHSPTAPATVNPDEVRESPRKQTNTAAIATAAIAGHDDSQQHGKKSVEHNARLPEAPLGVVP
jgi:hypothetical protein